MKRTRIAAGDLGCLVILGIFLAAVGLGAGYAYADLGVTKFIGLGVKRATAAGGTPVSFVTSASYSDSTDSGVGTTSTFSATHTKDANTTFIVVATVEPGENDNDPTWPAGSGYNVTYCGSPMTFITGSKATSDPDASDNDNFMITWWYIRGPSAGACTVQTSFSEFSQHNDISGDPPNSIQFLIEEFKDVLSAGTPYDAVNTVSNASGTTGSITLTPSGSATMSVYGIAKDGSSTIAGAVPSVNLGSVDQNIFSGTSYHQNSSHYDASGAKSFTWTWGSGISRLHGISGFHLLPN